MLELFIRTYWHKVEGNVPERFYSRGDVVTVSASKIRLESTSENLMYGTGAVQGVVGNSITNTRICQILFY